MREKPREEGGQTDKMNEETIEQGRPNAKRERKSAQKYSRGHFHAHHLRAIRVNITSGARSTRCRGWDYRELINQFIYKALCRGNLIHILFINETKCYRPGEYI